MIYPPAPTRMVDERGMVTREWLKWFTELVGSGGIIPPAGGITQLTGDVTAGPGSGSQVAELSDTGVTPGTYGDATHVGQFTVDVDGRLTFAQNVVITVAPGPSYVPLTDGAEPPVFITDGMGNLVLVPYP